MTKFVSAVTTIALTLLSTVAADSVSTTYPGRCVTTDDCTVYGPGLDCIAVDSSTTGLEQLSMCVPAGGICSGSIAGTCPTFSSWPSKYRKVMPVCAFVVVPNCNKQMDVTVVEPTTGGSMSSEAEVDAGDGEIKVSDASTMGSGSGSGNGTVECYKRNFTANGASVVIKGIYQCLDARKYIAENLGHLTNLTTTQMLACGGNNSATAPTLCNGQGTCAPKTAFAQEYECKCNKGFDGDAFCASVTSNECSNLGQCGALGTCTLDEGKTTGECTCKAGSTGDQCNSCDANAKSGVCSGHGSCNATTGACTCSGGYSGSLCADKSSSSGENGAVGMLSSTGVVAISISTTLAIAVMFV